MSGQNSQNQASSLPRRPLTMTDGGAVLLVNPTALTRRTSVSLQGVPTATTHLPTSSNGGVSFYASPNHDVKPQRYITSNDPRGYLPVYEYMVGSQHIMMDSDDGYVLWTSICKALGKSKADITKMVESDPELPPKIRRVKGGYLKVQGTWIPHEHAMALARKIAWPIKDELIPLFGPDFPGTCLAPTDPGFADFASTRRGVRRNTTSVASSSQTAVPSQAPSQSWMSPPPGPQRRDTAPAAFGENGTPLGYSVGVGSSPRGSAPSPGMHGSPPTPSMYHSYATQRTASGHQPRQSYPSQTPSPTHTIPEGLPAEVPYREQSYPQYPQYSQQYGGNYMPSSSPVYAHSPTNLYHQPMGQQHQNYPAYHQPSQGDYPATQPSTPSHSAHSTEYGYASHGVSDVSRQPCDTYPQPRENIRGEEYASQYNAQQQQQQTHQPQGYSQYQQQPAQHAPYGSYRPADSNVRFEGSGYGGGGSVAQPTRSGGSQDYPYGPAHDAAPRTYPPQPAPYPSNSYGAQGGYDVSGYEYGNQYQQPPYDG